MSDELPFEGPGSQPWEDLKAKFGAGPKCSCCGTVTVGRKPHCPLVRCFTCRRCPNHCTCHDAQKTLPIGWERLDPDEIRRRLR